jgi:tripartite-type tricarboxylate transporter receptor subunit TctC
MPRPVIERLDAALLQVLDTADMQRFMAAEGAAPARMGAEAFQQLLVTETARWAEVARVARVTAE